MSLKPFRFIMVLVGILGLLLPQWLLKSKALRVSKDTSFELYYGQGDFTKHEFEKVYMSVFEDAGEKTWQVKADFAANDIEQVWSFYKVDGVFKAEEGNRIVFFGDKGNFNPDIEELNLNGNVRASSSLGYNFKTDALDIEKENEEVFFSSEEEVLLFDDLGQFRVKAVGFRGDMNSGVVDLLSEVWSKKTDPNGTEALIESDKAKIQSALSTIKFYENLRVSQDKFKIKGEEASFYINNKTNEVESVRVRGNIFATDGVKTALSDKVDLKLKEDAIIFQGSPRIRVGDNEMVGEEILITNNQQNVQVIRGNIKSTSNPLEDVKDEEEVE
jgi:LPS export ABC transporter protein LptC